MGTLWMVAWYAAATADRGIGALTRLFRADGSPRRALRRDGGALSLEWLVIAGIVFAAAVAAGIVFNNAITSETSKLP
jgi:hypothetical protein